MPRPVGVKKATKRLPLWDDDWVEVKAQLTVGEITDIDAMAIRGVTADGRIDFDFSKRRYLGVAVAVVAWSFVHVDGYAIPWMPNASLDKRVDVLRTLDTQTFNDLAAVVEAYYEGLKTDPNASGGGSDGEKPSSSAAA